MPDYQIEHEADKNEEKKSEEKDQNDFRVSARSPSKLEVSNNGELITDFANLTALINE